MSEYTDGTYTIYSEHVGSCDEAERMATTLQALYPSVQFIVLHGVEGCGAGYAGDNEALGLSIDTVASACRRAGTR